MRWDIPHQSPQPEKHRADPYSEAPGRQRQRQSHQAYEAEQKTHLEGKMSEFGSRELQRKED